MKSGLRIDVKIFISELAYGARLVVRLVLSSRSIDLYERSDEQRFPRS